jgi:hypothetical protein
MAGAYTVTVTNAATCTATATATVVVNALPTPSIAGTSTICNGTSTTLTSSGGTSYLWSNAAVTAAITVSPTITTTYSVTVTNGSGCTAVASQIVTVNALPTATATGSTVCVNGTITLGSSGGTSYSWSGPSAFTSTLQNPTRAAATVAMAGAYSVTVTNVNSCTAVATATVVVNIPVSAGTATNLTGVCLSNAGTANIDLNSQIAGETLGGTWTIVSGAPGANFTAATGILNPNGLASGTYVFRYTINGIAPCTNDTEDVSVTMYFCCPLPICIPVPTFTKN